MGTFREGLLPALDVIRGIPGQLGLRLFEVTVVQRSWSGPRAGIGGRVDTSTAVRVALGTYQTKVRQVTERDIIASGGVYNTQQFVVGPITPPFTGSAADGDAITAFEPPVGTAPTEVFFNIKGPGFPTAGGWFKKVGQDVTKSFRYTFVVEKTAVQP